MLKKIKISKKGKRAQEKQVKEDIHTSENDTKCLNFFEQNQPDNFNKIVDTCINVDDYKVSPLEKNEDLSDTSSETNFEEEIRKLIGVRNTLQPLQYSRTTVQPKLQENVVVEFPETINSRTSFVADNFSLNRGSIPVGNRGSGVSKRN